MPEQPRIAILGANGQVGFELCRTLSVLGDVLPVTRDGEFSLDLSDPEGVKPFLDQHRPDVIVNAAAYTAVDKAESEPDLAFAINAEVPKQIGEWAAQHAAQVVHYSTDYVFDGSKDGAYSEDDEPNPCNVYGQSKLAGDSALLSSGADAWILRVSWVYGLRGKNFLRTMQQLMAERDSLSIVADQVGSPSWSRAIAEATLGLLSQLMSRPDDLRHTKGVYHLSGQSSTSWHGFAEMIATLSELDCALQAISTSEYPTPARRPMNSRMSGEKFRRQFGLSLPDWQLALKACLSD